MPQDKIIIRFQPKGDKNLIKAIQSLALAQSRLEKNTKAVRAELKRLGARGKLATKHLRNIRDTSMGAASAFSVMRSKLLLASFAFTIAQQVVGRFTNAASDAEETANKFNVVFGDNAAEVRAWANTFGDAVGRATTDIMEFASVLQDTFVPLGFARSDAAALSVELTQLALDVASFQNATDEEVLTSFQSALVGNHETVRKYGITITEAKLQQEALTSGLIDTNRALTDSEKVQARLNLLFAGSKDAQNDLIRTQGSYVNQVKAMQAEFKNLSIEIGKELMPAMREIVKGMKLLLPLFDAAVLISYTLAIGGLWGAWKAYAIMVNIAKTATLGLGKAMKRLGVFVLVNALASLINNLFFSKQASEEAGDAVQGLDVEFKTLSKTLKEQGLEEYSDILDSAGSSWLSVTLAIQKADAAMADISSLLNQTGAEISSLREQGAVELADVLLGEKKLLEAKEENLGMDIMAQIAANQKATTQIGLNEQLSDASARYIGQLEKQNFVLEVQKQLEDKLAAAEAEKLVKMATLIPSLQNANELQALALDNSGTELIVKQELMKLSQEGIDLDKEEIATVTELIEKREKEKQAIKQRNAVFNATKGQIQQLNSSMANFITTTEKGEMTWTSFGETMKQQLLSIVATFLANLATFTLMNLIFPGLGATMTKPSLFGYTVGHTGGQVQGYATGGVINPAGEQTFQTGGGVDNVPAMLQEGEYVIRRSAVESIGVENLNRMNRTGQPSGGGVNITFSGNVMSSDFIENEAIPQIKDALRRGADIGIS